MSSYLTFYLKPKGQDKHLVLMSYSRNTNVYQEYYTNINPTYIGNDDGPKYTELLPENAQLVVTAVRNDITKAEVGLRHRIEAYKELGNMSDEAVQDIAETKEYIKELEETASELQWIANLVSDIQYSDFEKVLINID